jgi:hypothetical protein
MARPKDPQLERLWRRRLARHSTCGLSIAEFCSRERITPSSFSYWKRRLAAVPSPAPLNPPLFVPLRLEDSRPAGPPSCPGSIELELPHQVRLRFDSPPEPEWLGRVVAVIAGLAAGEANP